MRPSPSQQPRRGPWTAEEQAAIEHAIAEGRLQRIENGQWRNVLPMSFSAIIASLFAVRRRRGPYG